MSTRRKETPEQRDHRHDREAVCAYRRRLLAAAHKGTKFEIPASARKAAKQ